MVEEEIMTVVLVAVPLILIIAMVIIYLIRKKMEGGYTSRYKPLQEKKN